MKNLVIGTEFWAELKLWSGSFRKPTYEGTANIQGKVVKDYYDKSRKHWITFLVTKSDSKQFVPGKEYKKQGKNLYSKLVVVSQPDNYEEMAKLKDGRKIMNGMQPHIQF